MRNLNYAILNRQSCSELQAQSREKASFEIRLLLVYLQYLLSPKAPIIARICLQSSVELARRKKKSWFGDVCKAASKLPIECPPHLRYASVYWGTHLSLIPVGTSWPELASELQIWANKHILNWN
jgi:hypothetical protein